MERPRVLAAVAVLSLGAMSLWCVCAGTALAASTDGSCATGDDVRQAGIKPNSADAASANTKALRSLVAPGTRSGERSLRFPNPSGGENYYFDDVIPIADGTRMDLCGSKLSFVKKTVDPADDYSGFLYAVRNFTLQNGAISVAYDGTGHASAGSVIRLGNRKSEGRYFGQSWDAKLPSPQGRMTLRNLQLSTNNPAVAAILMTGGLDDVTLQSIKIDGGGAAPFGIYYEFGFATSEPVGAQRQSAHATNLHFKDIEVRDLATGNGQTAGVALVGAYNADIDHLYVNGGSYAFSYRPGEALFYRPWRNPAVAKVERKITLRNIVGENLATGGAQLTGAESNKHGYLNSLPLGPKEQTDLMSFVLDGFSFKNARGYGVIASGPVQIRNGKVEGSKNGIILTDECTKFDLDNVTILNSGGAGIRASFGAALWNPVRRKSGSIRNSFIAGSKDAPAISLNNSDGVLIENNRLGFRRGRDSADESTQRQGIAVMAASDRVVARGNDVATSAGAKAYALAGTGTRGNSVEDPRGVDSSTGPWEKKKQSRDR